MKDIREEHKKMIGHELGITGKQFRKRLDMKLIEQNLNVNSMQGTVLVHLMRDQIDINQQQLADHFLLDKTMMTRIIDHLEENNLVKRVPDTNDRRQKLIKITNKGRKLHDSLWELAIETEKEALREISAAELEVCYRVLEKVRKNLTK